MNDIKPAFPTIAAEDSTPLVDALLELLAWQAKQIEALEQEILKLKGETTRPKIKPSKMDDDDDNSSTAKKSERAPKANSSKAASLKIDETITIEPENVPPGSRFKGYRQVVVQDLILKTHNTCYCLAEYQTLDGDYISGQLPAEVKGSSFGKDLITFILYQYHHQHVTQPLLLELLPMNDLQIQAVDQAHSQVWAMYRDLKAYKLHPQAELAQAIRQQFTNLIETKTEYATLNRILKQFGKNSHELLRVLDKPYLPLHNNLSECDIREYVKRGRRCRDTFASLKKTCRKQGVSFWAYLKARLLGDGSISPLTELIQLAATGG